MRKNAIKNEYLWYCSAPISVLIFERASKMKHVSNRRMFVTTHIKRASACAFIRRCDCRLFFIVFCALYGLHAMAGHQSP